MVSRRLGPALLGIRRLWSAGTVSGLSDARLLEQFIADGDELAFDALMTRHGPLVWSVCRSILNDPHDVEDAFQASFLILVRKAPSLRVGDSLCGWLYRVSYRVAQEARVQRDRRRVRERAAVDHVTTAEDTERARDELLGILNQEINRLPEKYRLPIVLCRLEGLTREQAAGQLGLPPGTVATRLARGLDRLRQRMRRRVGDDAVGLGAWLGGLVSASVPGACREATTQAALALARKGWAAAGLNSSAFTLAGGVHRALFWTSARSILLLAFSLAVVPWVASGWLRSGVGQAPPPADRGRPLALPQGPSDRPDPQEPGPVAGAEEADRLTYVGKVLDPNGQPLSGASVYLQLPDTEVVLHRLGTSGADGRFRAMVSQREVTRSRPTHPWRFAKVVATAPGYGPVWEWIPAPTGPDTRSAADLTLRLTWDDVPIEGRILTFEGRPVVGARIVASTLTYGRNTAGAPISWDSPENVAGWSDLPLGTLVAEAATDDGGRFRITGLGRDRLVTLGMTGPHLARQEIQVQTRSVPTTRVAAPGEMVNGRASMRPIYGASFIHVAEPGRSLEGIVRDRSTGQPIAGARVNTLTTDGQGRFQVDGLPQEFKYPLQVHGPAGSPYFHQRLTIAPRRHGLDAATAEVELSRGVLVRGRLTDRTTGEPMRGTVLYAPVKGNPHIPGILGQVENGADADEGGRFAVIGLPGRGILLVTAGTAEAPLYPTLRGALPEDRGLGLALPDDEFVLDALPRPLSLVGSHAYKVIDIPEGRRDFEQDFDLALHPGRTVTVRVVDPSGKTLRGLTAFGLRETSLSGSEPARGDGSFVVRDLDAASPRRVLFHQPERDLGGFLDLTGNESGDVTVRLSPCGSIRGRVVDRAGMPIAGAHFGLVYDDGQGIPHIAFPAGRWVPTAQEIKRDRRTHANLVPSSPINLHETSGEDGRFQIRHVVPGARFHLQVIITQAGRRLGMKAPRDGGRRLLLERAISAAEALELGDVRILPEELRGHR